MEIFIPESEVDFEFMRSSGPGGQNVNKVETKVRMTWAFESSVVLSEEQKSIVREKLVGRINKVGELYLVADSYRSQERNRQEVVDRMRELVGEALEPEVERKTKVPKKVKRKLAAERREIKQRRQQQKQSRQDVRNWE